MAERVSDLDINRSYLARQLLLERSTMPARGALEHLVGLQAQDAMPPYLSLWARLQHFSRQELEELLTERKVGRVTLMRGTVHMVSSQDALRLRPLLQPEIAKAVLGAGPRRDATRGIDPEHLAAFARQELSAKGSGMASMTEAAARRWPEHDARLVAQSAILLVPTTQVPPRGLWKRNDRPKWALLDKWFASPCEEGYPGESLISRYLQAFGPATFADMQSWSGLTGMRTAFENLRPGLRVIIDESGRELFDVADAPWPGAETPAPVRFLGAFDNLWLAHKDRSRIVDPAHWSFVMTSNGVGRPSILIDGRIAARYRVETKKNTARLTIEPFRRLTLSELEEVEAEGRKLLAFLEPEREAGFEIGAVLA